MKFIPESLEESLNFERGIDPKYSMRVGIWSKFPKIGDMQKGETFNLYQFSSEICKFFNLYIENWTGIDTKSNFNWEAGYQRQFVTMNLEVDKNTLNKFMGAEYMKILTFLMGEKYIPPIKLGISSEQKHWIKSGDYEFIGNNVRFFIKGFFIKGGRYTIPINFAELKDISKWVPNHIKDEVVQAAIWDLRYKKDRVFYEKKSQGPLMKKSEHIKLDVKKFVDEFGQAFLENLMKQNYMWKSSIKKRNWKISNGILEFID